MIAGGGTGGHVFPGIALAEAFLEACPGGSVSFVGTESGLEARAVPARGYAIDFVPSGQVRGKGAGALRGIARMTQGFGISFSVLRRRRPDAVFGVGGYASVPVALAAALSGIPLFLQEQNAAPGRANRLLGRMARRVYAGFAGAVPFFPAGRAIVTGTPVRRDIVAAALSSRGPRAGGGPFTVFAMGGSQGARSINGIALAMARTVRGSGRAMRFILQTGRLEFDAVDAAVRAESLPVEAFAFSDRIWEVFPRADAVLMRAGALSVAETALFGKPAVLVPYPFAADRHQERNAEEFCAAGGGVWMRQEEAAEAKVLEVFASWADDPARLAAAAAAAAAFGRPGAAGENVRSALREAGIGEGAARV